MHIQGSPRVFLKSILPPCPDAAAHRHLLLPFAVAASLALAALSPPALRAEVGPAPSCPAGDFAGVFDPSHRTAPPDLSLAQDGSDRASALAFYFKGLTHEAAGDSSKAISAYQNTLSLAPANPRIARRAAEIISAAGAGIGGGKNLLEAALAASPGDPTAKLHLSAFLASHGGAEDRARALILAKETVQEFPENPEALEHYVGLSTAYGQKSTAAVLVNSLAVEDKVRPARFWLALARSAILIWPQKKGDASPLTPGAKIVRSRTDGFFAHALAADPADPLVAREAADFFDFTGRLANAATVYENLVRNRDDLLAERARLAELHRKLGRTDEAASELESLAEIDPRQPSLRRQLADLYESAGLYDKATPHAELALALGSGSLDDHLRLGRILEAANSRGSWLAHARHSFALFPDSPHAALMLGRALYASSDFPQAASVLGKALILCQTHLPESLDSDFYLLCGNALARSGDPDAAQPHLVKALDSLPNGSPVSKTVPILTALADAQFHAGNRTEAIKSLRRAHFASPDDPEITARLKSWETGIPDSPHHP